MGAPWLQTATGRAFDLIEPRAEAVDFAVDVAESLARIPRFAGHVGAGPYSVAQHCVLGSDWILRDTGRPELATAFLLHGAHKAYAGDIATPVSEALVAIAESEYGPFERGGPIRHAIRSLKTRIDWAIFEAAGIALPTEEITECVEFWQLRMEVTERAHLCVRGERACGPGGINVAPIKTPGAIKVWPWVRAADEYRDRLRRLCPAAPPARL